MRLSALSCLLFVTSLAAQQATSRSYDLRPLTAPLPGLTGRFETPHLLLPIGPVLPGYESRWYPCDSGSLHLEQIAAPWAGGEPLVAQLAAIWSGERGTGQINGDWLDLRAPANVHAEVQDMLRLLTAIRQQTRRVTLFELPASAGVDLGSVLTANEVDELLRAAPPLRATTATVALDVPWFSQNGRSIQYVRDLDVEVAEKTNISDPKLDVFFTGSRLGLCLTPLIDGRCLVRLGLQTSELLQPLAARELPGRGLGTVHLPAVGSLELCSTAALPPGGGLLGAGDRGRGAFLLRVEPGTTTPLQFGTATALPLGDLAIAPLAIARGRQLDLVHLPGEDSPRRQRYHEPDAIAALARIVGDPIGGSDRTQAFGSHVVMLGAAASRSAIEEQLQRRAQSLQTTSLRFRVGTVENATALGHLAGRITAEELAAAITTEARLPTLPDHEFAVSVGSERAYVADYEVEIAGKARAANPVIRVAFDGFRISGALRRAPGQVPQLEVRLQWCELPKIAPTDLANPDLGIVDTPAAAWVDVEQTIALQGAQWHIVDIEPDPATPAERSLVLLVRAL